jgi:hypothetical protein
MSLLPRSSLLVAAVLTLAAVSPASAREQRSGLRAFDAVETGSSVITSAGPGVFKVRGEAAIRGTLIGKGSLDLALTLVPDEGQWKATGRFKITAANGDVLRGTSRGNLTVNGPVNPVEFFSRVTGGTGRFAGASGWLVSRGTSTIASVDSAGAVHTIDEATCKGRLRLAHRRPEHVRH